MQKPFSPHNRFFTSLKHLEKRLKLENNESAGPSTLPQPPPPPPPLQIDRHEITNDTQQTDSLGTPLYLYDQSATNTAASNLQQSEAPKEFLSTPLDSPPPNQAPPQEVKALEIADQQEKLDLGDEIELLMQLLRLSDCGEVNEKSVLGDDEFYDRIVGVKGPKNLTELERLERWIKHFVNGEKTEPFRLAHLLLGKAAFLHSGDGFEGIAYPSTIDEFLRNEAPTD